MPPDRDLTCDRCGEHDGGLILDTDDGGKEVVCSECAFEDVKLDPDSGRPQMELSIARTHGSAADRPNPEEIPFQIVIYEETETGIEYVASMNKDEWTRIHSVPIEELPTEGEDDPNTY